MYIYIHIYTHTYYSEPVAAPLVGDLLLLGAAPQGHAHGPVLLMCVY